jgi:subtilase family serine protease
LAELGETFEMHSRTGIRMKRGALVVPVVLGVLAVTVLAGVSASADSVTHQNTRVCNRPAPGYAGCLAIRHDTISAATDRAVAHAAPSGYGPTAIRSAYALGAAKSGGRTVAIVDAFDDPKAEADLGVYRKQFGLPACTTANGCFKKVNQTGGTTPPRADSGWSQEISLDLDMVSATCPDCKIRLVESADNSFTNLGTAVNRAASTTGVKAISNSYGGSDTHATSAYNHPGIAITASTGDSGYGVQSPASYGTVTAVGGTSLFRSSSARGWHETAWNGAGSGCSTLNARPTWQTTATKCSHKASADVSAVADPNTGVAVYDSFANQGLKGWLVFGGTSVASPIIASVYALSGNTAGYPALLAWSHTASLIDIIVGNNGTCPTKVWCTAGKGWDGPTGLGTPKGTGAF